jgi:signal transduction histidine kinase
MANPGKSGRMVTPRVGFIFIIITIIGVLLFVMTYLGIKKSRQDSLALVRQQGIALLESLTLSADNALKANSLFDLLVQEKFSDLVSFLQTREKFEYTSPELADFAQGYGVAAILIFDKELNLEATGARGVFINLNSVYPVIIPEIERLIADENQSSSYDIFEGDRPGDVSLYYLEKTNDRNHVVAIIADALFYVQVKEDIGIGYLVQKIAREIGIEYILFQTPEGIIISSRRLEPIPAIATDPFLSGALTDDSVNTRLYEFQNRSVLELVKRFTSAEYGDGLFRIGLSLEKYYAIVHGYDREMIVLSCVIFAVLVLLILYLSGKQKRIFLDRSYQRIKSLSEKVFDSINAGLVVINRNGLIEMANRQFYYIMDLGPDTIEGRRWEGFEFHDLIDVATIFGGAGGTGDRESTVSVPSGRKYLLINTGRLYNHKNQISGIVAVVYDYTRIRELEETARRRERLTEMGDLAAGVAHEIRNPLNAISIAAQRLLSEFDVGEGETEARQFVGQIRSEAGRLNDIINRFLSMARSKSESATGVDISKTARETVELLRYGHRDKRIVIEDDIQDGIMASVSEDRLKQLIINLVKNGVEAVAERGGKVTLALTVENGHPILSISDTGPGIPENIRDKIFSPYFTTRKEGTGLGLSIVHQIVEEFKAEIEIDSREDQGTEFRITFP